jgi:hypothetical protein
MLRWLDTLIGFSLIMLVFSLVVTALVQFVTSWLNTRGRHLRGGLAQLLMQVHPQLNHSAAKEIATAVLRHPLVSRESSFLGMIAQLLPANRKIKPREGSPLWFQGTRLGTVIEREKLIKLLAGFAAKDEPLEISEASRKSLLEVLGFLRDPAAAANTGDAAATGSAAKPHTTQEIAAATAAAKRALDYVRLASLQLEVDQPELATHLREGVAIAQEMQREFVAKLNAWFDTTMERVTGRFVGNTRIITLLSALLVVAVAHLDAIEVFRRISMDPELRSSLVAQATAMDSTRAVKAGAAPDESQPPSAGSEAVAATSPVPSTSAEDSAYIVARQNLHDQLELLRKDAIQETVGIPSAQELADLYFPRSKDHGRRRFAPRALFAPGLLFSVVLMSFGAPFWFKLMNQLLKLRPALAQSEDRQREQRRTNQGPTKANRSDERGDLEPEEIVG